MCLALGDRKLVAAFVLRVACVAFDPDVGELVAGFLLQGLLPEGWARGWKRRGWKKSDGSPALNPDLWEQALEQEARHKITYVWVKGHAGHPENERCDQLAVAQSQAHGGRQGR